MSYKDPAEGLEFGHPSNKHVPEELCIKFMEVPKPSGWKCELFGMNGNLTLFPNQGNVPNRFWRWMQYLAFGNKWIKLP